MFGVKPESISSVGPFGQKPEDKKTTPFGENTTTFQPTPGGLFSKTKPEGNNFDKKAEEKPALVVAQPKPTNRFLA